MPVNLLQSCAAGVVTAGRAMALNGPLCCFTGWLLFSIAALPAFAQTEESAAGQPAQEPLPAGQVNATSERADPFSPTEVFENPTGVSPEVRQRRFIPSATRPARLPELRLRGIARGVGDESATVLLEIDGYGTYIVTEGDTISLQNLPAENVIRIREITPISVIIEAGSFGELIVVR